MNNPSKSITHFPKAIAYFTSINDYTNKSKAKFGLAHAYSLNKQADKQCQFYYESIIDYKKGKEMNPNMTFQFNSNYSSFDQMVNSFIDECCK